MSEQVFKIGALGAKVTVTDRAVTIKNAMSTRVIPVRNIADVTRQMGSVRITDNAGKVFNFGGSRATNAAIVEAILDAMSP